MSKYSTTSQYLTVNNEIWSINAGFSKKGEPLAIYTKQLKAIINQLNVMTRLYSKVFVVRFDLHLKEYTKSNEQISRFSKLLLSRLKSKFKLNAIGYAWCREQGNAKQQHYHMAIFLEGRKLRGTFSLFPIIQDTWWFVKGGHMVKVNYRMVFRGDFESRQEVIYHLSYLAKMNTKGNRAIQTKDYACSRLK